jgi:dipeptidyl aminopeptidase/acylaminoacyl peptidase
MTEFVKRRTASASPMKSCRRGRAGGAGAWLRREPRAELESAPGWYETLNGAGYRVIAMDCRGHGESDKPHDPAAYDHAIMAEDVRGGDGRGRRGRAFLMGYSMGGFISMHVLMDHPDLLRKVVIGGVARLSIWAAAIRVARNAIADALLEPDKSKIADPGSASFREFAEQDGKDRQGAGRLHARQPQAVLQAGAAELARSTRPVLVVCGENDALTGPPGPLAAAFADGRAVTVRQARSHDDGGRQGLQAGSLLTTGRGEMVLHDDKDVIEFLTDGYGQVLGHIDQDSDLTDHVFLGETEAFKYQVKGKTSFELVGVTAGSKPEYAAEGVTPSGKTGLYTWGPSGYGAALFDNPAYDIGDIITDERNGRVIGATYMDDGPRAVYFDPSMQRIQESLEKDYPGQSVSILSKDDAGATYVILTQGPKNPPILSLFTPANRKASVIDEAYESLKPADLGDVRPYPYKARDGLDIHAYLTLPPGRDPHNLPTVIFPHGGPEDRDEMAFDWWAQFMASRGYAVLQPNFRGSSGYGGHFVLAGDGEWAGKVQYDVQDGVAKLIADGIADPKRICIVGASYGGYMALAGATFSPDLYACAVSFAGLSDLDRMLYTGTTFESETVSIWKRRIGADVDKSKLVSASPANFVDRVKIPILLLHSDKDTTVPIEQSQIENDALKHAGKQVEFITLSGDDHDLEFPDTRIKLLTEIERFLAAHIGT